MQFTLICASSKHNNHCWIAYKWLSCLKKIHVVKCATEETIERFLLKHVEVNQSTERYVTVPPFVSANSVPATYLYPMGVPFPAGCTKITSGINAFDTSFHLVVDHNTAVIRQTKLNVGEA
uniref:Uncharacterized protein n=1 Tax=Romanomermis culicivorax TaxID=13658 RepID=A0A915ITA8_ROMCU